MARKKEERAIRAAHRKEKKAQKYLTDDESLANFVVQLNKLGLELRDIPGDGNCLFRSLGDQLDGHSRCHLDHRQDVARFMAEHRADFEPFVEDDVPFEQHLRCLRSPGTYAGNDAIVAFARLHQLTVVIHQLNSPLWEIHGTTKQMCKQIHISYHNGDHYSSVRRIGDKSESPNNIHFLNGKVMDINNIAAPILPNQLQLASPSVNRSSRQSKQRKPRPRASIHQSGVSCGRSDQSGSSGGMSLDSEGGADGTSDTCLSNDEEEGGREAGGLMGRFVGGPEETRGSLVHNLAIVSGCKDRGLIDDLLLDHGCDFDSTLTALRSVMSGGASPVTGSDSDTSSTLSSLSSCTPTPTPDARGGGASEIIDNSSGAKPKAKQSSSHRRRERKQEKKLKAGQRHRERVMISQQNCAGSLLPGHSAAAVGGRIASSDESDVDNSLHLNGTVITTTEKLQILQI